MPGMSPSFAAVAAGAGRDTSPQLLTRLWQERVAAKDWPGAARIAAHPGVRSPLRDRVWAHPNTQVRIAVLRRADLDRAELLELAAGETRTAVLTVVCAEAPRFAVHTELVDILLAAWEAKPTRGTATLIVETVTDDYRAQVSPTQAWPILSAALAGEPRHAPDGWRWWLAALRGPDVSTALTDPRVATHLTRSRGSLADGMWARLLTRPGRDEATVRADTDTWLSGRSHRGRVQPVAAHLARECGPTPEATIVLEQMLAWAHTHATSAVAAYTTLRTELAHAAVVDPPVGFGVPDAPQPAVDAETLWAEYHDCVSAWPVLVDLSACGPRPLVVTTSARERGGEETIRRFVESADDSLAAAGWLLAARTLRGHWPEATEASQRARFRGTAEVMAALDVCAGARTVFAGLTGQDRDAAALALLRARAQASHLRTGDLRAVSNHAQEWLLERHLFDLLPWRITAGLITDASSESERPYRDSAPLVGPLADWLVTVVEHCPDPVRVWALIDAVAATFEGSTGDLLDAVADMSGIAVDFDRTPAPVSDVVVTVVP